jgi:membrane dipeptidase
MNRRVFLQSVGTSVLASGPILAGGEPKQVEDKIAKRARELHQKSTVVVIHDHRPIQADVASMLAGGVTAKVFQIGVDVRIGGDYQASALVRQGWKKQTLISLENATKEIAADPERLLLAKNSADIHRAKREGKIAIMLGVEGAKLLEGDLANLSLFHKLGLRELQLRWAVPNQIVEQDALTEFGRSVVRECQRLGIIVDLTHIPEKAFHQVMKLMEKPMIVSHGTGRELGEKRIKAIVQKKGVIGIHFYSSYLGARPQVPAVLDALDYLVERFGIDVAGLGIDFFPTDGAWRDFQRAQGTKDISWAIPDLSHLEEVTRGLVARNYSDQQIEAILGGNFLRVCKEVFGK